MGEDSVHLPSDLSLEYHIVTLFEKLEGMRYSSPTRIPMQAEIRTLEFWRSLLIECMASFCYVFIVCGAAAGTGVGASVASVLLATSLSSCFTMATLTHCFRHISGAHVNPAVSLAMLVTKRISLIRAVMFVLAQCGGAVAGAAFLYGVTVPGYQGNLSVISTQTANVAISERFGVEVILTFFVVLTYFVTTDGPSRMFGNGALAIGAAYGSASFVSMPYLNPARSLGPSFVLNKSENHWVFWLAPIIGGVASGLIYEYILNPQRNRRPKDSADGDSSSIHSDEDTYDDLEKSNVPKFNGSHYNSYRPAANATSGYCPSLTSASLYSAPPTKLERVESLYGGTKSLYCKSPPLTRANLNRSQSVYTKSNSAINRDTLPRPGPLVPAQSLYPMRLNQQQNHVQNQNVQNQLQQRSESTYGIRNIGPGTSRTDNYGTLGNNSTSYAARNNAEGENEPSKLARTPRPESMYGTQSRRANQPAHSDDSSYSSYHGSSSRNTANCSSNCPSTFPSKAGNGSNSYGWGGNDIRQSPPTQPLVNNANSTAFHHNGPQHAPTTQYT